ncbi:MAG: OmpA family protein [Flavobacteriaceae bacterium]|nr:OmpA family protein [Flavobacteriaceae bacterium]
MKNSIFLKKWVYPFIILFMISPVIEAQTKKLKRPSSRVGISSVDNFVRESFDLYDKVYMYDGYAEQGRPLDDGDLDVLENTLDDLTILSASAPDVLIDIDGAGVLKQGKATLQMNRAKKALSYSIKTAKKLLTEGKQEKEGEETDETSADDEVADGNGNSESSPEAPSEEPEDVSTNLEIYSKFDFVPGDKLLFFDDFSQDFIGDFPSKWNTNGSGEVVRINKVEGNWFEIKPGYNVYYIPLMNQALPEEYTVEFDIFTGGLDRQTSSTAKLGVVLDDNDSFKEGTDMAKVLIPFCQYSPIDITVINRINNKREIYSNLKADIRKDVLNQPHISIAVNKRRFRLWVNQKKYVDIPQLISPENKVKYLKFDLNGTKEGKDKILIRNLKIAEGGVDLRRKLMTEGQISTNGILFESGSAKIQPQSYGIIRQISQVLMQDDSIRLNIEGHTDADGTEESNLKLSKDRAEAVRKALIDVFKISGERLSSSGKGESEPVGDNKTTDGKAQNRRVVFKKV